MAMDYGALIQGIGKGVDQMQGQNQQIGDWIFDLAKAIQAKKEREQQARQFSQNLGEEKRQFDVSSGYRDRELGMQNRQLGLAGIDKLAESRSLASQKARQQSFGRDLVAAARMG